MTSARSGLDQFLDYLQANARLAPMGWADSVWFILHYGGVWSPKDQVSGRLGIAHGRWLRQSGPTVLPALAASALSSHSKQD